MVSAGQFHHETNRQKPKIRCGNQGLMRWLIAAALDNTFVT